MPGKRLDSVLVQKAVVRKVPGRSRYSLDQSARGDVTNFTNAACMCIFRLTPPVRPT